MALTATATVSTRRIVMKRLNMKHPVIISITPDKPNILYTIQQKGDMQDVVAKISEQVKRKGLTANKAIIYCCYHREVANFYELFRKQLGVHFSSPAGSRVKNCAQIPARARSRYFITHAHTIFRQLFCALIRRITGASARANYHVCTRITLYTRIRAPTHTRAPTAYAAYTPRSREYSLWPATPRLTI